MDLGQHQVDCWECNGTGLASQRRGIGQYSYVECPTCTGTGRIPSTLEEPQQT